MVKNSLSMVALMFFCTTLWAQKPFDAPNQPLKNASSDLFHQAEQLQKEALDLYSQSQRQALNSSAANNDALLQIFFAYETGHYFEPSLIEIFIGKKRITEKKFDATEILALHKGAVDLIFEGPIALASDTLFTKVHGINEHQKEIIISAKTPLNPNNAVKFERKKIHITLNKSIYHPKAEWTSWN